jgi:hypothetical protein
MAMEIKAVPGDWVEVYTIVLPAGERAPQVPADTQQVPLEMRVRGFLMHEAGIGQPAVIQTLTGREMSGTLSAIKPAYPHGFGAPVPEMLAIGRELRALLEVDEG